MQLAWLNEDSEEREEAHIIQYSKTKVVKMGKLFELSCQNSLKLFSLLIAMHDLKRAISSTKVKILTLKLYCIIK